MSFARTDPAPPASFLAARGSRVETGRGVPSITWPWVLRVTGIVCLLGAEVIHTSVMDVHMREWVLSGLFFLFISIGEGLLAAGLILFPSRRLYLVAVGVSIATVAVWAVSRTAGLPFGPEAWQVEPIGRGDSIATLFELATAGVLLPLALSGMTREREETSNALAAYAAAVAIVAAVVLLVGLGVRSPAGH